MKKQDAFLSHFTEFESGEYWGRAARHSWRSDTWCFLSYRKPLLSKGYFFGILLIYRHAEKFLEPGRLAAKVPARPLRGYTDE
jgi:hypothetical protein